MFTTLRQISTRASFCAAMSVAVALIAHAQTPATTSIPATVQVETGGSSRTLSEPDLLGLPQESVTGHLPNGTAQTYSGPRLDAVLKLAGASLESLRGRALAQYVIVEARDNYRVAFAVAELSSEFTTRRIILAHTVDGHSLDPDAGPWRVVVENELRPARWVRQVAAIRLRTVAD